MKLGYTLALLLCLLGLSIAEPLSTGSMQDASPAQQAKKLCVLNTVGLPTTVRFQQSISLTQAIKQAGIVRAEVKDQVWIVRRLESSLLKITKLDLKAIEKGHDQDLLLDEHDLVEVLPKKKQPRTDIESSYPACATCGCRIMPAYHGGTFAVPKKWDEPDAAVDDLTKPSRSSLN